MRKLSGLTLAALLTFGVTGTASAGIQSFDGSIAIQIATLDPLGVNGAGLATINGSLGGSHITSLAIPSTAFATAGLTLPVTDPGANPIVGVQVTVANGPGSFVGGTAPPTTGTLNGEMALNGIAKVCLFGLPGCGAPAANVSVPLSVIGVGGTATANFFVNVTVQGAPWTTGTVATAAAGTVTQMGFAHGPASATSSTAEASGFVRLVTPIFISTNIAASAVLPAFAFFDLHVPEPGTMLLLGSGAAGLVLFGRSRRR